MIQIPLVKPEQKALFACSIVFTIIPSVFVALRLIARRIANRRLDLADYLIVAAWFFTVALALVIILATFYGGFGWHRLAVIAAYGEDVIVQYHILSIPMEIFWTLSISLSKMSLLVLYIRVFPPTRLTIVSKVTCVGVALLAISGVLCTLLICQPIQANWYLDTPGRHCGSQKLMFGIYGVFNLLTDVMVLGLPIPSLLGLKLPTLKKIALVFTFAIGFLTCVATVIRLAFLTTMDYLDVTYSGIPFILMSVVEPSLAVSLACVPLLRPLLSSGKSRYSATGTREGAALPSFSVRGLHSDSYHHSNNNNNNNDSNSNNNNGSTPPLNSSFHSRASQHLRRKRGRSSCTSIPAPVLQYEYEMGYTVKEGMPIDIHELTTTNSEYQYQAEITSGHDSDEGVSPGGGAKGSSEFEISPVDSTNIVVKQEWIVLNKAKLDG